ncbi:MAG: magnesium transporter [Clostridiales bacterium]|nr:magnesium transporter [Clostridiales bacterium]
MNQIFNTATLRSLLEERAYPALREALAGMNEVDIAEFLAGLDAEQSMTAFRMLPKGLAADTFAKLDPDTQQQIVAGATDAELSGIINDLFTDDAVDMLEDMPASVVRRILKNALPENRRLINQFLNYAEHTAGSIMTAEFTDLHPDMTVTQAIQHIRRTGEDRETIYTCYVVGPHRKLLGVVTVRTLLLAGDDQLVREVMEEHVISVNTSTDQEETARLLNRYDFLSLPVVDAEDRLVGIVTVDDAADIIEQEATEDFEKMAAMAPSEKPYLKTGVLDLARHRIVWLLVLMISGMITGGILGRYEAAFAAMPLLVTFIPMLTDTGGNAGSQSSTLVIRGIAVGEITLRDLPRVLWKELRVSLLVGVVLSAVNFVRLMLTYPGQTAVALTVAITMVFTVLVAKTIGGALPLLAKVLHMDPAIMAAPLITTIVDAVSLVIYFTIAQALLPI